MRRAYSIISNSQTLLKPFFMLPIPFLLQRVLEFAVQHHDLLGVSLLQLLALRTLLEGNLHWATSLRFPYPTQHFHSPPFDIYISDTFAALSVGEVIVGASTVGQRVYIFGPHKDHVTYAVLPGILAAESL